MILVYTHKITPRVRYIFKHIFENILAVPINLTADVQDFVAFSGAKISYSKKALSNELFFYAHPLLFENGISDQELNVVKWNETHVFFSGIGVSALPFDPFAASFYLLTRYEEYLAHIKDHFARFPASESVASQHGFLQQPVVDIWAQSIKKVLLERFPDLEFPKKEFTYLNTIDIDNAYAYKEKGMMRTMGALARSFLKLNFRELIERTMVLMGKASDPFDCFDYMLEIEKKYKLNSVYFFLVGDYGENDKNISVTSRKFQLLIKHIADYARVGIHPSYGSNANNSKLKLELSRLERILNREVRDSRQHFLKLTMPDTYRNLLDLNIRRDYTMGYASEPGFRAGTSFPFHFYDLDMEVVTPLLIYPFMVMDGTLNYYQKKNIEEATAIVRQLIDEVKAVNGTFVSLWHNETLNDRGAWEGWRSVYEDMIKYAKDDCLPRKK